MIYVKSNGIVSLKYDEESKKIYVLLVMQNVSYSFSDIVLGNYSFKDEVYLRNIFRTIYKNEIDLIFKPYEELWGHFWQTPSKIKKGRSYNNNKEKYEKLIKIYEKNIKEWLAENIGSEYWTFPKGRNEKNEPDLDCAIREFYEETGIPSEKLYGMSCCRFNETIVSNVNRIYDIWYNYCFVDKDVVPTVMKPREIRKVKWIELEKLDKYLPSSSMEIIKCIMLMLYYGM